ncbi:MAG: LuxR C-terminal-related transcriptional regulator [Chlamydiota bacterium]
MGTSLLADSLRRDRHFHISTAFTSQEMSDRLNGNSTSVLIVSAELDNLPEKGFALLRRLRTDHPDLRTIILLDSPQRDLVVEAFRAGAKGIFCRVDPFRALRKCIYRIYAGEIWASNREMEFVLQVLRDTAPLRVIDSSGQPLLAREQEIVECIAAGLSNREIGDRLKLSEHTVKNYLARVYHKLGVSTRAEVIFYACTYTQQAHNQVAEELLAGLNGAGPEKILRLAEQGFALAQHLLARMYRDGVGVAEDPVSACAWFLIAEETCRQISRYSRSQRKRLEASLLPDQIRVAKATCLQQVWKLQQQIDAELGAEEEAELVPGNGSLRGR